MRNWRIRLGNERGVALVLALMMLLALTGLLLAFISVSALEPQISRNLADTARARYLAEAGLEVGFATLVNTGDAAQSFTPAVASGTSGAPWVPLINNGTIANVTTGGAAAEAAFAGTYTVIVRNDALTGDSALTGQAAGSNAVPAETASADTNKIVIMRSTGTFNGATKTIEVVVRRQQLPPFPGAVNLPGLQTDTFINKTSFDIDGRDYACSANCDTAANWVQNAGVTNKWGVATQTGTQSNIGTSYENNVQNAVSGSATKLASIKGRDETAAGNSYTTGLNTIQADPALNPTIMQQYIDAVANFPGTTILQSTQACPMQLTGSSTPTSTPTLSNGCTGSSGVNRTLDLGTRDNPKLVYFRGDTDPSSQFTGLTLNSGIKGAGVLIVEDGDLKNLGSLTWDGVVIVTGNYVGSGFMSGSNTTIRGAFVANERQQGESSGFFEFYMHGSLTSFSVKSSKQNIDMVQLARGNHSMTNWREL
jgi:Tfp pilus assembly protein PilX